MASPTLLVLAAGMGSRYGGIKQMDPVGPDGEFILDYSVYDAIRAGFKQVVFIIRQELEAPLREHFGNRLEGKIEAKYVVQSLDKVPEGYTTPASRQKPWGTGHAVWCAREAIQGPFAMVNADDFYGKESFAEATKLLGDPGFNDSSCGIVAFRLNNTLSENGSVSRGICAVADGLLTDVVERTTIEALPGGKARFQDDDGSWKELTGLEPTSMNLWAFPASVFTELDAQWKEFLAANIQEPKKEFFIPTVVNTLIKKNSWKCIARTSPEKWFGMTYSADRAIVLEQVKKLTADGVYPAGLWR